MNAHPAFQIVWKTKRLMRVHVSSFSTFFSVRKNFSTTAIFESWISLRVCKYTFHSKYFFFFIPFCNNVQLWENVKNRDVPFRPSFSFLFFFFSNRNNEERNLIFRLRFSNIELFAKGLRTYERIFIIYRGKNFGASSKRDIFYKKEENSSY